MNYYKAIVSYKGTRYFGWQSQPHLNQDKATIQETILDVLKKISKYQKCSLVGASRTDSGVHALGQVIKITLPLEIEPTKLKMGLNSLLPKDIRIINLEKCLFSFSPIHYAQEKIYHYYFTEDENPLLSDIMAFISVPVHLENMQEIANEFVGNHDYYNFSRRNSNVQATFRNISKVNVFKKEDIWGNSFYTIEVVGKGFLKQMVRYMVATIIEGGKGTINLVDVRTYLREHQHHKLVSKAASKGLHLIKILY